jgi:hypothetical protein
VGAWRFFFGSRADAFLSLTAGRIRVGLRGSGAGAPGHGRGLGCELGGCFREVLCQAQALQFLTDRVFPGGVGRVGRHEFWWR